MRSASFAPVVTFNHPLDEAFPDVDPGFIPYGSRIIVQMRTPKDKTSGNIILPIEVQDTIKWNTQVGKVVAIGPLAFKNRTDMKVWPEGEWCKVGDYVRTPRFGGDKFEVKIPGSDGGVALFAVFDDLNLLGKITCDPRDVIAFV